jgi:hypothetical protein
MRAQRNPVELVAQDLADVSLGQQAVVLQLGQPLDPVPASTVFIRMRLLVSGLIRWKRTVSASVVAG